jgi:phosphate-selective porin OprO/OprP
MHGDARDGDVPRLEGGNVELAAGFFQPAARPTLHEQDGGFFCRPFLAKRMKKETLMKRSDVIALITLVALAAAGPARADEVGASALESLNQRLGILERKNEIAEEAAASKAQEAAQPKASGPDGFSLKSADGNFILKFRGLIQADSRWFVGSATDAETDTFLLRRIRPTLEGTLYRDFDFRITPDFANNSATPLYDAYLDVKTFPAATLRVGKFKPPVGLERLQSGSDLLFVERAYPTALVPSRDAGLQLFGEALGGKVNYAVSLTNGVADGGVGETDVNDGKEGAARLFATPFKERPGAFQGLGLGLAGSYAGSQTTLPSFRTPGQLTAFSYAAGVTADGERSRLAPQLYWRWNAWGLLGEYVRSSQVLRRNAVSARIANEAWQAALSYVLTGEEASFKGVKPRRNFDPKAGGWGAWEVAGRLQRLDLDPAIFDRSLASPSSSIQRASAWSAGINWYLNKAVKFVLDYEQTEFDQGAGTAAQAFDRPTERIVLTRTQISF